MTQYDLYTSLWGFEFPDYRFCLTWIRLVACLDNGSATFQEILSLRYIVFEHLWTCVFIQTGIQADVGEKTPSWFLWFSFQKTKCVEFDSQKNGLFVCRLWIYHLRWGRLALGICCTLAIHLLIVCSWRSLGPQDILTSWRCIWCFCDRSQGPSLSF